MNNINDDELRFVVKHYKSNCLDTNRAWQRFKAIRGISTTGNRRKIAVAASATLAIGIAVAAGIVGYHHYMLPRKPMPKLIPVDTAYVIEDYEDSDTTDVFSFNHTPINEVLGELSRHYHTQLSASDTTKSVTGEIEASSVEDAIEVLQTTLGIKIERK